MEYKFQRYSMHTEWNDTAKSLVSIMKKDDSGNFVLYKVLESANAEIERLKQEIALLRESGDAK